MRNVDLLYTQIPVIMTRSLQTGSCALDVTIHHQCIFVYMNPKRFNSMQ